MAGAGGGLMLETGKRPLHPLKQLIAIGQQAGDPNHAFPVEAFYRGQVCGTSGANVLHG
jgi:hypothetical protein